MSEQDDFDEYLLYTAEEIKKNSMTPPPPREEKLLSRAERLRRWINTVNN